MKRNLKFILIRQQNQSKIITMQCTYCHTKIYRQLYACEVHEDVQACQGCREYDCHRCKAELKKYLLEFCIGCKEHKLSKQMYGNEYYKFCLDCCLKAYKNNASGKKVVLSNHIFEPQKYEVYRFLKNFCNSCRKDMNPQRIQSVDSGLKQIYPLEINLCRKCSSDGPHKENTLSSAQTTKLSHHQSYESQRSTELRQSNINKTESNVRKNSAPEHQLETPLEKWKKIQKTEYPRCLTCGHLVLDDGLITDQMIVCRLCMKLSGIQEGNLEAEKLTRSRNGSSRVNYEYANEPVQRKSPVKPSYEPYLNPIPPRQQVYTESSTPTFRQAPKNPNLVTEQLRSKKTESTKDHNYRDPELKKFDSQGIMENVPISVKFVDDSELIQCGKCGIRLQINSSIWEENMSKPICRCCYSQIKEKIRKERERYERPAAYERVGKRESSNLNEKRTVSPDVKSYVHSQRSSSPFTIETPQKSSIVEQPTQPIIKQEEQKRPANKVKRTESWDESIIVESVEDHERRKRERQRQDNRVIEEVNEEEGNLEGKKVQSRKEEPVEPIIIEEANERRRVQSRNSWDENIILEPVKVKIPTPEKPVEPATFKYENQPKKAFKEEPVEPVIIEERKQEVRRVKKLESWDQEIVLEPVSEHLKRKQLQRNLNVTEERKQFKSTSPLKQKKEEPQTVKGSYAQYGRPEPKNETKTPKVSQQASQMQEFDRKYKEMKQKLEKEINNSFDNLSRISGKESPIGSLASSRAEAYSRYYRETQQANKTSNPRSYQTEKPNSPYYTSPSPKASGSTLNSTSTSRRVESNSTLSGSKSSSNLEPTVIGGYYQYNQSQGQGQNQTKGKQSMTGYITLDRKQQKKCQFCGLDFQTTLRDYYVRGTNVCWECFAEYNKAIGNAVM